MRELGERKIALFCCCGIRTNLSNYLVGMIYAQLIKRYTVRQIGCIRAVCLCRCIASWTRYANISLAKRYSLVGTGHHAFH